MVTIDKLPSEVLLMIFETYARSDRRLGSISWIRVTHVCRTWRELAISSVVLWNHIYLTPSTSLDRVAVWVERSQQSSLRVTTLEYAGCFWHGDLAELNDFVLKHLHRTRELELLAQAENIFDSVTQSSWPLKKLALGVAHRYADDGYEFPLLSSLDTIFPELVALSLQSFDLDLSSARLPPGLTQLQLWEERPRTRLSVEEMLRVLASLPLLENFHFGKGKLRETTRPGSDPLPTVILPHLRSLRMSDSLRPSTDLLTHLQIPKGLHFDINLRWTDSQSLSLVADPATPSPLAAWVMQVQQPFQAASLNIDISNGVLNSGSFVDNDADDDEDTVLLRLGKVVFAPANCPPSQIVLDVGRTALNVWNVRTADVFFSTFDYSSVTTLALHTTDLDRILPRTFAKFDKVQTLWLVGFDPGSHVGSDHLGVLTWRNYLNPAEDSVVFAGVKTLYLDNFHTSTFLAPKTIRNILLRRADKGSNIEKLFLGRNTLRDKTKAMEMYLSRMPSGISVGWATDKELKELLILAGGTPDSY